MSDGTLDDQNYVTVGKFLEPVNAQMAKGMLESAGIECFLQGENANNLLALAFRVRLQVHRKDEAAARDLLADSGDRLTDDEIEALGSGDE
jgi:Putative prokaryotic signal transducing protein